MSTGTKIGFTFTVVLTVILALGINAFLSTRRLEEASFWVTHTHKVLEKLDEVLLKHSDAETGQRGFVLTADESYLEPYTTADRVVRENLDALAKLVIDNPAQETDLATVQALSHDKFAEMQKTIDLRRASGMEASLALIRTDGGKKLMDAIRGAIGKMESREHSLLDERNGTAKETAHETMRAFLIWTPLSLLFLAMVAIRITRTIRFGGPTALPETGIRDWWAIALRYGFAAIAVTVASVLRWKMQGVGTVTPFITLFPAVLLVASLAGGGPGVFATISAAVVATYFFLPPAGTFAIANTGDFVSLTIFVCSNLFLCVLAERLRRARWVEAVAAQKELLGVTLASIGDAVIVTNAKGLVTFLNHEAEKLTGWKLADADGRPLPEVFNIVNEDSRLAVENPVDKVLRLRSVVGLANHTILIAKDGRETPIDDSGAPVQDPDGTIHGVVLVFRDFTEHKRVEADLRAAKVSAENAKATAENANQAKNHFLAVLSHELRTPLTPVTATLSMLQADPRWDEETRQSLDMIQRNVQLEARLIDDLLDVTRIERGKIELSKEPVAVSTLVRHTAEVCASDIKAGRLRLHIDAPEQEFTVFADVGRMQQVLWNLLKNAIKFTPAGGDLFVRFRGDGDGHVVIDVADSGKGIDGQILPRIFNAFEQGDRRVTRQFGGLGLGLAISKAIVDMHGGTLAAHSEGTGKGATFTLRLPLLLEQSAEVTARKSLSVNSSDGTVGSLKILLVEDHADTAEVMTRLLRSRGHQVQVANNVASAVDLGMSQPFDLLLSDLGLPDGSGLDLMRTLRSKGWNHPAIAISGYGQEQDMRQSKEAGFSMHLVKPVSLQRLHEAIAETTRAVGTKVEAT